MKEEIEKLSSTNNKFKKDVNILLLFFLFLKKVIVQQQSLIEKEKNLKGKEMDKLQSQLNNYKEKIKQLQQEKSTLISQKVTIERELKQLKKQNSDYLKEVCFILHIIFIIKLVRKI